MLRNIFSNWVGLLVTGVITVILTPILIRGLGDYHYGIWVLVFSVLSYYGLLDLGMHTALLRFVAKSRGEKDRQSLGQILVTSLAIATCVALLVIGITAALLWLLPKFFGFSGASRTIFRWVFLLMGFTVAVGFVNRTLENYLCGLRRFDLFNAAKIATSTLRAVLQVFALRWGYDLVGLAGASLAAALISLPLHWIFIRHADSSLGLRGGKATWSRARELMGFGFFSFLSTVGNYARFYLNPLVIGRVLTVQLITPFNIANQMVEYLRWIVNGAMSPLITSFSRLVGEKSGRQELQHVLIQTTRFTSLLCLFVGSLLVLNGQALIRLWVGERFLPSYTLLVILTAAYVLILAQVPSICLLYALNKHRAMGVWTLGEGFANLVLSVYLAPHYGLVGVALGTAIPMGVVALLVQPWYVLRLVGLPPHAYVRRALARPVVAAAIFFILCQLVAGEPSKVGFFVFLWGVVWQVALFGVLAFTVGFNREDRRLLFDRWHQLAVSLGWEGGLGGN